MKAQRPRANRELHGPDLGPWLPFVLLAAFAIAGCFGHLLFDLSQAWRNNFLLAAIFPLVSLIRWWQRQH